MKKRIIGLLMALCLIVGLLPVTAMAASTDDAIEFVVVEGTKKFYRTEKTDVENSAVIDATAQLYAKTDADGKIIWPEDTEDFSQDYNIAVKYDETTGFEITFKDANLISLKDSGKPVVTVKTEKKITVILEGTNSITSPDEWGRAALYLDAKEGSTITGTGSLTAVVKGVKGSTPNKTYHGLISSTDLTIKDATIDISCGYSLYQSEGIVCGGNLLVDNATLKIDAKLGFGIFLAQYDDSGKYTGTTTGNITFQNGAKVDINAKYHAFRIDKENGSITIDANGGTEVTLVSNSYPVFGKTPTLKGDNYTAISALTQNEADATPYTLTENTPVDSGAVNEYGIHYFHIGHTHTGGTATCTTLATCTICNREYGETAAHTFTRTDCSQDSICTVCNQVAVPAGGHVGGTATCTAKAKCDVCQAEYGELAEHTPVADDKDCSTATKCTVCSAELVAAKTHRYTDDTDKTCNNYGCSYTRSLTGNDNTDDKPSTNPATGDVNILLTAAIALTSAVGLGGVTVLRKKEK